MKPFLFLILILNHSFSVTLKNFPYFHFKSSSNGDREECKYSYYDQEEGEFVCMEYYSERELCQLDFSRNATLIQACLDYLDYYHEKCPYKNTQECEKDAEGHSIDPADEPRSDDSSEELSLERIEFSSDDWKKFCAIVCTTSFIAALQSCCSCCCCC